MANFIWQIERSEKTFIFVFFTFLQIKLSLLSPFRGPSSHEHYFFTHLFTNICRENITEITWLLHYCYLAVLVPGHSNLRERESGLHLLPGRLRRLFSHLCKQLLLLLNKEYYLLKRLVFHRLGILRSISWPRTTTLILILDRR